MRRRTRRCVKISAFSQSQSKKSILDLCEILLTVTIHSFIHQWLCSPLLGPGLFLSFVMFFTQTVRLLGWVISPSQGRYLNKGQHERRTNAHTDMPWVGFEPTIPAFERTKTVHTLDRAAIVIGNCYNNEPRILLWERIYGFHMITTTNTRIIGRLLL
jgi:hypothetical protein